MKTETQQKNNKKTFWLIIGIALFFFISIKLIGECIRNREPLKLTYKEWVTERPDNEWLIVEEVKADVLRMVYFENILLKKKKPKEIFVPLISSDLSSIEKEVCLLLRVETGPIFQSGLAMINKSEMEILKDYGNYPEKYLVNGPFKGYKFEDAEFEDELYNVIPNLSADYLIIDSGKDFPLGVLNMSVVILIALLIYASNYFKKEYGQKESLDESIDQDFV